MKPFGARGSWLRPHENDYSQLPLFLNLTFNDVGFIFHVYLP